MPDRQPPAPATPPPNRGADAIAGLAVLAGALAVVGLLALPYGYYILLRTVFCIACGLAAYQGGIKRRILWMLAFAGLVVLYNPVAPIHLGRGTKGWWLLLNLVTVASLIIAAGRLRAHDNRRETG